MATVIRPIWIMVPRKAYNVLLEAFFSQVGHLTSVRKIARS